MRPGAEYPMVHGPAASVAALAPSSSAATSAGRSPWQSPVPYLFGGLAAMLGLIALSLLALACSYWKLSGILAGQGGDGGGGEDSRADGVKVSAAGEWRGHVVVIMAGDERPTFLATPAWSGAVDAVEPVERVAECCGGGARNGKAVEREASARRAGDEDDARSQNGEQTSSVISET